MTNIEAGKTYTTRNGLSARILATDKKGEHPIAGLITMADGNEIWYSWREDGSVFALGMSDFDLIIPTELKSVWINWYGNGDGYCGACNYNTREDADLISCEERTHVIQIITKDGKPVDVKIYEVEG